MKYCTTAAGSRVAYHARTEKSGIPMVLLHGFCEDSSVWKPLLPGLKNLPLIRMDLPGFGHSDLPEKADMASYADAVHSVLEAEGLSQCVLVGHSMGGYAALEYAALHPGKLAGLGLFHSHPYTDSEERMAARRRGIETLQSGKRDLYVAQLFPGLFTADFVGQNQQVLEELVARGRQQSPEAIITALQAMLGRRDHQQTLKDMPCPVLFLLGDKDTLVPIEQGMQAALLPNTADLQLLSGVAHMGMWEAPEICAKVLQNFWLFCQH